jgi:site-specific recombinase XerD
MLNNIGWAIIDYLRYGRPKTESPYLFLSANVPHNQLQTDGFMYILKKHMRIADIKKERKMVRGMHSLRHALARNLMEQNIPLPVVSEIMGHTSFLSSSPYLKVDIEGLRCCALTLGGLAL